MKQKIFLTFMLIVLGLSTMTSLAQTALSPETTSTRPEARPDDLDPADYVDYTGVEVYPDPHKVTYTGAIGSYAQETLDGTIFANPDVYNGLYEQNLSVNVVQLEVRNINGRNVFVDPNTDKVTPVSVVPKENTYGAYVSEVQANLPPPGITFRAQNGNIVQGHEIIAHEAFHMNQVALNHHSMGNSVDFLKNYVQNREAAENAAQYVENMFTGLTLEYFSKTGPNAKDGPDAAYYDQNGNRVEQTKEEGFDFNGNDRMFRFTEFDPIGYRAQLITDIIY